MGAMSATCDQLQLTEEGFLVMGKHLRPYRIETVYRFRMTGHTTYRDLRHCARQHSTGRTVSKEADPPPAEDRCSNGPPNAQPTAGLVLRYKAGCYFASEYIAVHCRGPPSPGFPKIRRRRLSHGTA